jgi:dipeptidyl-peptidase-4
LYVYGGPHSQLITDSWLAGAGLFLNYLAQQGYIVFTIDNRGTSNRGLTFEQATYLNLGNIELKDQIKGIEYIKRLSYIDTNRLAVYGWSFGGFMATSLMLKYPNLFKVGIAGGPVIDWKNYEVMYGERYMSTPEKNPEGYKNANLLNYVKNLKGKLLIIHGGEDPVVLPINSLQFIQKCIENNIQVDYFVYPDQEHNVLGKKRQHLYHKIENYLNKNID